MTIQTLELTVAAKAYRYAARDMYDDNLASRVEDKLLQLVAAFCPFDEPLRANDYENVDDSFGNGVIVDFKSGICLYIPL